jgi:hypothetical protein
MGRLRFNAIFDGVEVDVQSDKLRKILAITKGTVEPSDLGNLCTIPPPKGIKWRGKF